MLYPPAKILLPQLGLPPAFLRLFLSPSLANFRNVLPPSTVWGLQTMVFLEMTANWSLYILDVCSKTTCGDGKTCLVKADGSVDCVCSLCPQTDRGESLVCGSDGKTYASPCFVKRRACLLRDKSLIVASNKPCGKTIYFCSVFIYCKIQ